MAKKNTTTTTTTTPTRTRRPRATTPATTPAATVAVPTSLDDIIRIARGVTMANADDTIRTANAGHGIVHAARNTGRFSGRRIVAFQNDTFLANPDRRLSDVQLLAVWRMEFPAAVGRVFTGSVADGVSIVRGVRAELNRNGHGEPHRVPAGFKSEPYAMTPTPTPTPVAS